MIRNDAALALAIFAGTMKFDHNTPCTTKGCGNPLLTPEVFNPTSKIDNQPICDACRSWEMIYSEKKPAG